MLFVCIIAYFKCIVLIKLIIKKVNLALQNPRTKLHQNFNEHTNCRISKLVLFCIFSPCEIILEYSPRNFQKDTRRLLQNMAAAAANQKARQVVEEDLANVEFETSEDVEVIPTFDSMNLREDLLRGIYAYGKSFFLSEKTLLP